MVAVLLQAQAESIGPSEDTCKAFMNNEDQFSIFQYSSVRKVSDLQWDSETNWAGKTGKNLEN